MATKFSSRVLSMHLSNPKRITVQNFLLELGLVKSDISFVVGAYWSISRCFLGSFPALEITFFLEFHRV